MNNNIIRKIYIINVMIILRLVSISSPCSAQVYSFPEIIEHLFREPLHTGDLTIRYDCFGSIDDLILSDYPPLHYGAEKFYHTMVQKGIMEIKHTTVTEGAVVWQIYNHGFLVKTPSSCFVFDIGYHVSFPDWHPPEIFDLVDELDVLFISHEHGDHFYVPFINQVMNKGKPVVGPVEFTSCPISDPMEKEETKVIAGLTVTAHDGHHGDCPIRQFEVITPEGLKFLHTGDNDASWYLPSITDIDILMINTWLNEYGSTSSVEGVRIAINLLKPEVTLPGHIMEISHIYSWSPPYSYRGAIETDDGTLPSEYHVLGWGERFNYKDNHIDVIRPNSVENLSYAFQQDSTILTWNPPQAAGDGDEATFYRVIVNNYNNYILEKREFHYLTGPYNNFKVYAYDDYGNQSDTCQEITVKSGEFFVNAPQAQTPPVIDGHMDNIWYSVASVPMEKPNLTDGTAPDGWLDCYAGFRMMADSENLYLFIEAHDDEINTSNEFSYFNDSVELFFDIDNSKNIKTKGYDDDDIQLRFVYGAFTEDRGRSLNSQCVSMNTDHGYQMEIQIPGSDIHFELKPEHVFGFEIGLNDNDGGNREHHLQWWSESNESWLDPSIFGTARITGYVAADPMLILHTPIAPVIDGSDNDSAWEDVLWVSSNWFVDQSNGSPLNPPLNLSNADDWNDCRFNFKMLWQDNVLYFYADVYDNIINTSQPNYWMNDCIQIFIDGNNDKTSATDANDCEYTYEYADTPDENVTFIATDFGWTIEAQMDLSIEPGITLSDEHLMGLEVHLNDNDTDMRDLMCQWWSRDDIAWANPGVRGTVQFSGENVQTETGIIHSRRALETFRLEQNYPNPFNPTTSIGFEIPSTCFVSLKIYNLLGQEVAALVNKNMAPGIYQIEWNGQKFPSGMYLYQLKAGTFTETRKLVLQK